MSDGADHHLEMQASMVWLADDDASHTERREKLNAWAGNDPVRRHAAERVARAWGATPKPHAKRKHYKSVGLAVLLILSLGAMFWSDLRIASLADHSTGDQIARSVVLSDGVVVDLDANSAITYHADDQTVRIKLLRGATYVSVDPAQNKRVEVASGNLRTVVTGTAFSVRLSGEVVRVVVSKGSVDVIPEGGSATPISAGKLVIWQGEELKAEAITIDEIATWREGWLVVHDKSLSDLARDLDRYFPGVILVANSDLGRAHVTGNFRTEDVQAALRAAVAPYGGSVTQISPWFLLVD